MQAKLDVQLRSHAAKHEKSDALLIGKLYDERGNRMGPTHARKDGIKYRYYVSLVLLQGQPERAGTVSRVPAPEVESLVCQKVRSHLKLSTDSSDRVLIGAHVNRVDVRANRLIVTLRAQEGADGSPGEALDGTPSLNTPDGVVGGHVTEPQVLIIPWRKPPSKRKREIIRPESASPRDVQPIRAECRVKLVAAIARGRFWLDEILSGTAIDVERIAAREKCSVRHVNMTISLAFLAPDLVKAAVEGRLPRGVGLTRLFDLPSEWPLQYRALGLAAPQ